MGVESKKHPPGLYRLFFIEAFERLAFYTMVNVLLLYAQDSETGGLGLSATESNEIYGLYLAFVYFTPFIGGMLADRYIGYRRAVVAGGLTMATGLFLMSVPGTLYFYLGLTGLVLGNGLFKPNISVMVGNLYEPGDPKRDAGFNIFYMGINIGAFVASFLSSSLRGSLGWLWTFRGAGVGLLIGLTVLAASWQVLARADRQPETNPEDTGFGEIFAKILLPAFIVGGVAAYVSGTHFPESPVRPAVTGFLFGMIPVIAFFVRLGNKAQPDERAGLRALLPIYVAGGTFFMILHLNGSAMTQWARDTTDRETPGLPGAFEQEGLPSYYLNADEDVPRPDPRSLLVAPNESLPKMAGQKKLDEASIEALAGVDPGVEVVRLPLKFDDGSEPPAAQLKRAAQVFPAGAISVTEGKDSHGAPVVSVEVDDSAKATGQVVFLREVDGAKVPLFVVGPELNEQLYAGYAQRFGHEPSLLPPGEWVAVASPELYQSFNALFVVAFTPLVVIFFAWLVRIGKPLTTARKVFLGMSLATLALLLMALAGVMSDGGNSKVSALWLVGFYAIVTIGELCISPMGLSLVTKLTPKRLVGLTMGGWFMATAFGNNLSGFFGGIQHMMSPPAFFLTLAAMSAAVAAFIGVLLPWLDKTIEEYGG